MEICIFGGSFNPIHNGHIHLARQILRHAPIQEVWLIVSPHNPLKENTSLMDDQLRLQLARIAVQKEKQIKISDIEMHLPRPSYTWQTMKALEKEYPQHRFSLLIGADNWVNFDKWHAHQEILKHHYIYIYPRKGYTVDTNTLPDNVRLLDVETIDISSTQIRKLHSEHKDISTLLPKKVADILKNIKI